MTVRVRTEWHGEEYARIVQEAVTTRGLPAAAATVEGKMKDNLSAVSPSSPGSPPGKDTGLLRSSISYVLNGLTAKIGTPLKYGAYLERGFTATPKTAKALPVPLNARAKRLQRQGLATDLASGSIVRGGLRASGVNLQYIAPKGKSPMLVETTAKGKIKKNGAAFVLKKVIRVLPRPWALRSLFESSTDMNRAFTTAVQKHISANVGRLSK